MKEPPPCDEQDQGEPTEIQPVDEKRVVFERDK
jgi:hypothetical protein